MDYQVNNKKERKWLQYNANILRANILLLRREIIFLKLELVFDVSLVTKCNKFS